MTRPCVDFMRFSMGDLPLSAVGVLTRCCLGLEAPSRITVVLSLGGLETCWETNTHADIYLQHGYFLGMLNERTSSSVRAGF